MQKYRQKSKRVSRSNGLFSIKKDGTLISYDKAADAAYFSVKKGKVAKTIKLDDWLLADIDKKGILLGVEMLFVSLRAPRQSIVSTLKLGKIPTFI